MGDCIIVSKIWPRTETYTVTEKNSSIDMGEWNNYRYIDTSGIPNSNSDTYTPTSRSASLDMGAANTYRYVNTNSVPNSNSATYTPSSNGTALDMGATNTYRYVNTNTVYTSGFNYGVRLLGTNKKSVTVPTEITHIICCGKWYSDWPDAIWTTMGAKSGWSWTYSSYASAFSCSLSGTTWTANKTCVAIVGVTSKDILNRIKQAMCGTTGTGSIRPEAIHAAV